MGSFSTNTLDVPYEVLYHHQGHPKIAQIDTTMEHDETLFRC